MMKHGLLAVALLAGAFACEKKVDRAPTAAEQKAATAAEVDKDRAAADKQRADHEVAVAKEKQDLAEKRLDTADDKADDTKDKVGLDWKAPDDDWGKGYSDFALAGDRSADVGDYTLERARDGAITAYRKVKQVAGDAFADLKDAALATQVKAKLAADDDTRALGINVDAQDHIVHLRGKVKDAGEAGEAVRLALSTPGTERVVSHLTWK